MKEFLIIVIVIAYIILLASCSVGTEVVKEFQKGKASWYSTESCQRDGNSGISTASGEKFNDGALTCARRSYDFGGYYQVCNIDNDKCVVVKHNDYGGNEASKKKGVIIDLSKGAFERIADLNKGIINVMVRRING